MNFKTILFILISIFIFYGCQKEEKIKYETKQDVSFLINELNFKSTQFDCPTDNFGNYLVPSVAKILIDGISEPFYPEIFYLDGKLYTQSIKLPVIENSAVYTVNQFLLLTNIDGDIVMATPEYNSEFSNYLTLPSVPFDITVNSFDKNEINIEVLCFIEQFYEEFGFVWFEILETFVREQNFFGDLCIKSSNDYIDSYYDDLFVLNDYPFDLPAIFKVEITRNDGWTKSFQNIVIDNGNAIEFISPLKVRYPDRKNINDEFIIDLYVYVAVGNGFDWVYFYTWNIVDNELIYNGNDGVVDFVIGNCVLTEPDLHLPPYMNLPLTANINILSPGNPGYWDLNINSFNPIGSYDIPLGNMTGWCADAFTTISPGNKTMSIYNSLYPNSWPSQMPSTFNEDKINRINWLFNNLQNYGITISGDFITIDDINKDEGNIIQDAIWFIIHGNSFINTIGDDVTKSNLMANESLGNEDFIPLPGGWASVLTVPHVNGVPDASLAQLIFTVIDP